MQRNINRTRDAASYVLVLTEWKLFRDYDFGKIFASMEKPAFIFDGRNILDHRALFELGFNVYPLGQREYSHLT